ncbi:MAG TPA: polymer-forming cytoskeletal protein [Thermomicrobiales bacterium]|nr:polymer-forming cytoskeletal protein [Thermomicrobiales bacterium]
MEQESPASFGASSSRRSRHLGLAAFAVILLVATIALPVWSFASDVRSEQEVSIGPQETVQDDLYVMTNTFALDGRAQGDVIVAAREIDISGEIGGSLNAAGGEISISGTVERSVRVLSGTTDISGSISGDLLVFGGTVDITPDAEIGGDVHVFGGTLDAEGTVRGDVTGNVANLTVDGNVGGDVAVDVERVEVGSGADVAGSLFYVSPSEANIADAARVAGPVDRDTIAPWGTGSDARARFFSPLVRTVWLLATGAIVIALAPRLFSALNDNLGRPGVAAVVGLLSIVLIPIAAILLMVTVVGIPFSLLILIAYGVALYLSQVVVGQRIGTLVLPRRWNDGSRGYLLLSMTIGVILLSVLRFVPVPFVSSVVNALVAILGLGAAVMLLRQLRPAHPRVSP